MCRGGVPAVDALMDLIAQDKKVKRGTLTFILVRGIGQAFVENDVDAAEVRAFLTANSPAHDPERYEPVFGRADAPD